MKKQRPFTLDWEPPTLHEKAVEAFDEILTWHRKVRQFWADGAPGWSPAATVEAFGNSRLDRQLSLCRQLRQWIEAPPVDDAAEGHLILGWANLGSLVEGALLFFLSVYAADYEREKAAKADAIHELDFGRASAFYVEHTLVTDEDDWRGWLKKVKANRNAIHAFKVRPIGSHAEFLEAVIRFRALIEDIESRTPYPDINRDGS